MSVTTRPGKVIVRFFCGHQRTFTPDEAAKLGLELLDAAKKAAKKGHAFSEE